MAIDRYINLFSKLRSDVKPSWPAATLHRAPHKPFLLLAIMDLIAQGVIAANFVKLDADLVDTFDLYWKKVVGDERDGDPLMPYYHLQSETFWHLVPLPGMEIALANVGRIKSQRQLSQLVLGAKFDEELFELLLIADGRDRLRRILIETYFVPDARSALVEVGQITAESFEYSRELINRSRGRFKLKEAPEVDDQYHTESRSAAFRRVVVDAYAHTCAVCRVRIVTPEGRTAVAAAHIVPWSVSHNDDPRNGMALCGIHHWAFDQGLIGVEADYRIQVSPIVDAYEEAVEPIRVLAGRDLHLPLDQILWPAKSALHWHRENIFRPLAPLRLL